MLRALKRLLRPGGRIAYTTIYVPPGLAPAARRRAARSGPPAVASRSQQTRLLASAGFVQVHELDLTAAFAATARAWLIESEAHADHLAALEPPGAFHQRQHERRTQLAAINDGLLRRAVFSATRPISGPSDRTPSGR